MDSLHQVRAAILYIQTFNFMVWVYPLSAPFMSLISFFTPKTLQKLWFSVFGEWRGGVGGGGGGGRGGGGGGVIERAQCHKMD